MYDEFGYLKKKFRAKAKAGDSHGAGALASGGMGKAGWDTDELGVPSKEKNKDRSGFKYDNNIDANRGGRNKYFQNVPSARIIQRGYESGRGTRRGVDEWNTREGHKNLEHDRNIFSVENQGVVSSEAWPWGRFAVNGHGGTECVIDSENDQHGEWLRGRKRLRERDRILD